MNVSLLSLLVCPECQSELAHQNNALECPKCARIFAIVDALPRFVPSDNYAKSFGFQWNRFSQTQLDDQWGIGASRERFFKETRWPDDLRGQLILEAGCGAGRFTAHCASTGATLVSFDYSSAVEAAARTHADRENVHFMQADIHALPLRRGTFDKIFCIGVLQHCPDPGKAFQALVPLLKPGGEIVVDVYRFFWQSFFLGKYYLRPLTRRIPPERHFELALLDTFDMLSPAHDHPQTARAVRQWLQDAKLEDQEVKPGYNGLEARGRTARAAN